MNREVPVRAIPGLPGARIRRSLLRGVRYVVSAKAYKRAQEEDFAREVIGKVQP